MHSTYQDFFNNIDPIHETEYEFDTDNIHSSTCHVLEFLIEEDVSHTYN